MPADIVADTTIGDRAVPALCRFCDNRPLAMIPEGALQSPEYLGAGP